MFLFGGVFQQKLGHAADHVAENAHLPWVAGDADHPHGLLVLDDGQVDAGAHAGAAVVRLDHQRIQMLRQQLYRAGVYGADPGGIGAGQDHPVVIHDIHILMDHGFHLVHNALGILP